MPEVNAAFHKDVMERLLARFVRVRSDMKSSGDWFRLHDNAPAHNATVVHKFLTSRNVTVLHRPPYSPNMAATNYFFFPKLKLKLKGNLYDNVKQIQSNVTIELKSIMILVK